MNLADAPRRLRRLARDIRSDGPLQLAAEHARRRWKKAVDRRIAVFEWRAESLLPVPEPDDRLWVGRYARPEEVPPEFYRAVEGEDGAAAVGRFLDEFIEAGVLWVPWLAGRPAGYQWTRRGDRARPWRIELGAEATFLLSLVTFRPFRGQGVASRTLTEVCRREVADGGRAVGQAFVWDTASVRTFEAAGFRRIPNDRG